MINLFKFYLLNKMIFYKLFKKLKNFFKLWLHNSLFSGVKGKKRLYRLNEYVKNAFFVKLIIPFFGFVYKCKSWQLPIIYIFGLFLFFIIII